MSSDDAPSADLDNDGVVRALEIERLKAVAKTANWTVREAVQVAKSQGATLTSAASSLLQSPQIPDTQEIIDTIKDWVYSFIVNPLFKAFLFIPILIVSIIAALFWGSDLALKRDIGGFPGIGDIPIIVANIIIGAIQPLAGSILATVRFTNRQLVGAVVAEGGALTVPLLAILQMVELGILLFVFWTGVRFAATLPVGAQAAAALRTLVRPLKAAIGVIR